MLPDDVTECPECGKTIRASDVCCEPTTTDGARDQGAGVTAYSRELMEIWIDALASEVVSRIKANTGINFDWSGMRNAMQREVDRQIGVPTPEDHDD